MFTKNCFIEKFVRLSDQSNCHISGLLRQLQQTTKLGLGHRDRQTDKTYSEFLRFLSEVLYNYFACLYVFVSLHILNKDLCVISAILTFTLFVREKYIMILNEKVLGNYMTEFAENFLYR